MTTFQRKGTKWYNKLYITPPKLNFFLIINFTKKKNLVEQKSEFFNIGL